MIVADTGNFLWAARNCFSWEAFKGWAYSWSDQPEGAYRFATLGAALEWLQHADRPTCRIYPDVCEGRR